MTKNAVAKSFTMYEWTDGSMHSMPEPQFILGEWVDITPTGVLTNDQDTCIGQGIAYDFDNPGTIYWCNGPFVSGGGLYKTTDWGETWDKIGNVSGVGDLDNPLHLKIDPNDSDHLFLVQGVRGATMGFYESTDGGETFTKNTALVSALATAGVDSGARHDCYDLDVNPDDFDHVLVTFHYPWGGDHDTNSGIAETLDGGATWTIHDPESGWGTGHAIHFLYRPDLAVGDEDTWLLGTEAGIFRTTNAGTSWSEVYSGDIAHGGQGIYYAPDDTLYIGGEVQLRSTNNGSSFTSITSEPGWTIGSDGVNLFCRGGYDTRPMETALLSADTDWDVYDAQDFHGGFFDMIYVPSHGVMIMSNWVDGLWLIRTQ